MIEKLKASIPVYASAVFTAEIDTEGKTEEEIKQEFWLNCEVEDYICHHCANTIESDFFIDETNFNMEDIEFYK